jgi:hypothetical protein
MTNTRRRFYRTPGILMAVVAALFVLSGAFALQVGMSFGAESEGAEPLSPGKYIVAAHPYYSHPVTGVTEDSGQNSGIGQGMTESVLGKKALIEVYDGGVTFVTVRFSLMDYIEDIKISAQENAESEYLSVTHTTMQESIGKGTANIRFEIPGENAIVRAEFFVTAMGRVVIFFMNFSEPLAGSGDFITTDTPPAEDSLVFAGAEASGAAELFSGGLSIKTFIIISAAVIVVVILLSVVLRVRKKKKDAAEGAELADMQGELIAPEENPHTVEKPQPEGEGNA